MEKNEILTLTITDLTAEAAGIGRAPDGMVVFVPGTFYGETVRVKIAKVKKTFAYGILLDVLIPAKERIAPACTNAARCGGCDLWHVSYEGELLFKRKKVENAFRSIAGMQVDVPPVLGARQTTRYRNKGQFPVGVTHDGAPVCGLYASRSHRIVPVNDCLIQSEDCASIASALLQYMQEYQIPPYNEQTGKGLIRHLYTRTSRATGRILVVIVATSPQLPQEGRLIRALCKAAPAVSGILINHNPDHTNVVLGANSRLIFGEDAIEDTLCNLRFSMSHRAFFQVNPAQTETLYQIVLSYAGLTGRETVLDLYCGIGTITLLLAQKAAQAYGVEIVPEAVQNARENAARNRISNVEFFVASSPDAAAQLAGRGIHPDVVVVDPPRAGLDEELIKTLAQLSAPRIVYVSCDPGSLARDVKRLAGAGYRLMQLQPVDLFPRTKHIEAVAWMSWRSKSEVDYP